MAYRVPSSLFAPIRTGLGAGPLDFLPGILSAVVEGADKAPEFAAAFGISKDATKYFADQQAAKDRDLQAKVYLAQQQAWVDQLKAVAPWAGLGLGGVVLALVSLKMFGGKKK